MLAAGNGRKHCVRVLLAADCDVQLTDSVCATLMSLFHFGDYA